MKTSLLTLFLTTAIASTAASQQRLFGLATDGAIFEVVPHAGPSAALVSVTSIPLSPNAAPLGLAADPASGDLFALVGESGWANILRVQPATGQITPSCSFPFMLHDGLDRRFDGQLVSEAGLDRLVIFDPVSCNTTVVPSASVLGFNTSFGSVAFDPRGLVVVVAGDGTSQRIDPLDGARFPYGSSTFDSVRAIEVDLDGQIYLADIDGALYRSGPQITQVLPTGSPPLTGLAFLIPADGLGMRIACTALPNSTGRPSTIEALGTSTVVLDELELRCRDLPEHSFGYFLTGRNAGSMPVGSGVLCIAAPVLRYSNSVLSSGTQRRVRFDIDFGALPNGAPVLAGETHLFQYWHRDVGGTSNLSPALEVQFR